MAPILNTVEMLKLLGSTDANLHQASGIIERQVTQMVRLVDDLLDLTRIAEGKIELRRTKFDVAAAVASAIQTVTPLFETQKHQLSASLPTEPLQAEGDQDRIVQILVNLLTNAGKYTDKGGRIKLTAAREADEIVLRSARQRRGHRKRDAGPRLRYVHAGRRLAAASRRRSGHWLNPGAQLVELHGGSVSAHSEGRNRGSEFTVRLPSVAAASEGGASTTNRAQLSPLHILIVEDHADAHVRRWNNCSSCSATASRRRRTDCKASKSVWRAGPTSRLCRFESSRLWTAWKWCAGCGRAWASLCG